MKKIIFQGVPGAYSSFAAERFFGKNNQLFGVDSFPELFETLDYHKDCYGVVPIENSLIGSLVENYDLLLKYSLKIIGETFEKIDHSLLVLPPKNPAEVMINSLRTVMSHPAALGQCRQFFRDHPWITPQSHMDTAGAAKEVFQRNDPTVGAIASKKTAEIYHLKIEKFKIQDNPNNYTRFLILSHNDLLDLQGCNKLTVCVILDPASDKFPLFLSSLHHAKVKITKIESRPKIGAPFEYPCFLDLVCSNTTQALAVCTEFNVSVLGVYKQVIYSDQKY